MINRPHPRHKALRMLSALMVLSATSWASAGAPVVPDLKMVRGAESLQQDPQSLSRFRANGFVVVPRPYRQMFSPYVARSLPAFVTTDSLHRVFQIIYDDQLKNLEREFADDLSVVSRQLAATFQGPPASPVPPESWRLAQEYFLVAQALCSDTPDRLVGPAAEEVKLVRDAAASQASPLFARVVDYSAFRPRGYYADAADLRRYFFLSSWLSTMVFGRDSPVQDGAAKAIIQAVTRDDDVRQRLERMDSAGVCRVPLGRPQRSPRAPVPATTALARQRGLQDGDPSTGSRTWAALWAGPDGRQRLGTRGSFDRAEFGIHQA